MHGKLEKIHFPKPQLMNYLSEESKVFFLECVCRDSANDKINGLLDEVDSFYMEMSYFMKMRKYGLRYDNNVMVYLRNFCLGISFIINILIIADNE
jgi:inositol 1,4,5-triphosphate receptor type 3